MTNQRAEAPGESGEEVNMSRTPSPSRRSPRKPTRHSPRTMSSPLRRSRSPIPQAGTSREDQDKERRVYMKSEPNARSVGREEKPCTSVQRRDGLLCVERHDPKPSKPLPAEAELKKIRIRINDIVTLPGSNANGPEVVSIENLKICRRLGEGRTPIFGFITNEDKEQNVNRRQVILVNESSPSHQDPDQNNHNQPAEEHSQSLSHRDSDSNYSARHRPPRRLSPRRSPHRRSTIENEPRRRERPRENDRDQDRERHYRDRREREEREQRDRERDREQRERERQRQRRDAAKEEEDKANATTSNGDANQPPQPRLIRGSFPVAPPRGVFPPQRFPPPYMPMHPPWAPGPFPPRFPPRFMGPRPRY